MPEISAGGSPLPGNPSGTDNISPRVGRSLKRGKCKWRSWRRGLLVVLVLAACLYGFRAPILRNVAAYLVIDEPSPSADYVLILPGADRRYERAAQLYHAGAVTSVLLVESRPMRLERMGFLPTFETESRSELASRAVPAESITVIPGKARTDWDRARQLREWLRQQPDVSIVVLCDRFGGRKFRYIFDQILGAEYAGRLQLICLPERSYDENDWWQHREAIVEIFDAYLNLAFARLSGEDSEEWREWDPAEFKKTLR